MTLIEAAKQALEALEECRRDPRLKYEHPFYDKTITALRTAIAEVEKQEPLTDEDWKQLWAEFDSLPLESDFQDHMVSKYGVGHYTDADMYWHFQQQVIKQMVNAVLKGKNHG
jgi:hypothetical protein